MTRRRTSKTICLAALAVASDGTIILNIAHAHGPADPRSLLDRALREGRLVFIGVAVSPKERVRAGEWIDDSASELVGTIFGDRQRRRRPVARKMRKTPS